MRVRRVPEVYRNVQDSSITLSYGKPQRTLIWLHGLCDTADGFLSFFSHSHSPLYHGTKIKLLQAPLRHITVNNGNVCHGWYDMKSFKRFTGPQEDVINLEDVEQSYKIVDQHFKDEVHEWYNQEPNSAISPNHRVYIGGFSQGGAMALHYSLKSATIPAGVISAGGYCLRSTPMHNLRRLQVLLMHGKQDPQVREGESLKSYARLLEDEGLVEYHTMEGLEHSVNIKQLDVLGAWIESTHSMLKKSYEKTT